MAEVKFRVNNKIEVISDEEIYLCDVQDVKDEYLAISIPIKDSEYLPLRINQRIEVLYYDGSNIYKFPSIAVKRTKSNIPLIWISIPDGDKIKKIQRRRFVRVPVLLDVRFALVDKQQKLSKEALIGLKFMKGTLLDMSGGGVRLKAELDINKESTLVMILPVEEGSILVKCEVKRVTLNELGEKVCGLSFVELKVSEEDKIIKQVFAIMREQMKKGLKED